ncbi:MAG: CRTAC1 family protein [Chloroherpetonaceae bacterium]|nr:CRTAC1 family protein [Chthonomonadaceae bacterium]MDW8207799.1 CRTAC1 family protein [Chloroherpetonaceae bacterium]
MMAAMSSRGPALVALAVLGALQGCASPSAPPSPSQAVASSTVASRTQAPSDGGPIRFASVAERAGIRFALGYNGKTPLTILETAPGGCAFLDFDGDQWPDALLAGPDRVALYRNRGDGTFEDVTAQSGLRQKGFWVGCAAGDYNDDGYPDLFLTGYRCFALYRNRGRGARPLFAEVTAQSGIGGLEWSQSAAFADLNGDGRLDLFVSQYLHFGPDTQQVCQVGRTRSACGPEVYRALSGRLFLNVDGVRFRAVPWRDTGKTWGVLASDLLQTGRPALYLANDMMPGDLWTLQQGQWRNIGPASGTAYDAQGHLQGGMGVDSGDYDNDGRLDLIVTTYFAQAISLYHNDGDGLFTVTSNLTGIGPPTMPYVGFGIGFYDLDNDGWLDLIQTNGHVRDNVNQFDASQDYAQPVQVFRNEQGRLFADVSAAAGDAAGLRIVGRGMAFADYNRDGRIDVLICNLNGPAVLLENRSPAGHWLTVRLNAAGRNRAGLGALVTLEAGGRKQVREVRTNGSVLAARDPVAHFGLGTYSGPVTLTVRWPDGARQQVRVPAVDREWTVRR